MEQQLQVLLTFIENLMLPLIRVSSMMMVMVGISGKTIPAQVKVTLAIWVVLAVTPILPPVEVPSLLTFHTYLLVMQQVVIGVAIGFVSMFLLSTFILAGQILAMQTGLGFASMVDPVNGLNVAAVGQFYLILATLLFWAFDGHLVFIRYIIVSFHAIPINNEWWHAMNYRVIADWAGWMFAAALALSLAPLTAMLLINFSFGIMTRAAPQLNVFSIGFPITMTAGLLIIWLTMGNFLLHFELQWERVSALACDLVNCRS